jgi:hypothetical protein
MLIVAINVLYEPAGTKKHSCKIIDIRPFGNIARLIPLSMI